MPNKKQHIQNIFESMYAIKRKLIARNSFKESTSKLWGAITHSQWAVLAIVMKKNEVSVKEIAETMGVTSSAITQLINGLVKKGYLVRQNNKKDRRALVVKLSLKSKQYLNKMKSKSIKQIASIFSVLNNKELAQYATLNKKIADSILKK